jgi:purine-binding chemotaxis protein CheW
VHGGETASSGKAAGTEKLVCFLLHGQEYAAQIGDVIETLTVRPITRVFLTPPWLSGIVNLRGDVVAVLDLARLLGMAPTLVTDDSRILLARHQGTRAGFLVDALAELRTLDLAAIEPPPATLPADVAVFLRGIVTVSGDVVRLLDLSALFESDKLRSLGGAAT